MYTQKPLDPRLLRAGLAVTVAELATVFSEHWPDMDPLCPLCGHHSTTAVPYCPSVVLSRQLLKRRRYEDPGSAIIVTSLLTARDQRILPDPMTVAAQADESLFGIQPDS